MNTQQLHDTYENCPMWLLSYVDQNGELAITQYHDYDEMMKDIDLLGITYYTIENLFED